MNPGTVLFLLVSTLASAACARAPEQPDAAGASAAAGQAPPPAQAPAMSTIADAALPLVVVYKNPTCGCCKGWVDHMRQAGFRVEVRDEDNLDPVKQRLGVPHGKGSCHTAEVGGYLVEGHVPAQDVKRLLAEKPDAKGLVLPGMPMGSPGMEMPDGTVQPYTVELVKPDGSTSAYAVHGDQESAGDTGSEGNSPDERG